MKYDGGSARVGQGCRSELVMFGRRSHAQQMAAASSAREREWQAAEVAEVAEVAEGRQQHRGVSARLFGPLSGLTS